MFFLKKLIGMLLMPLPVALGLLLAALVLFWRQRRFRLARWLASAAWLLLFLAGSQWMAWQLEGPLTGRYPPWRVSQAGSGAPATIVVLGGGKHRNARLPIVARLTQVSLNRLVEGIRLYRALHAIQPGERLLLSGGPRRAPEALLMRQVALALGVPDAALELETTSLDTPSQARHLKPMLGARPFLLVTSAVHMPRAMALFKRQGLDPIPAASDWTASSPSNWMSWLPNAATLQDASAAWHEILGRLWESLRGETAG